MEEIQIIRRACDRYLLFEAEGRNRAVYGFPSDERFVLKVPKNQMGAEDNVFERGAWLGNKRDQGYIKYAACYLVWRRGVPLLLMERVYGGGPEMKKAILMGGTEYDWVTSVDCMQVGECADGEVRAFDYGFY